MGAVSVFMCRNLLLPTSFGPFGLAVGGSNCVAVLLEPSSWMSLSENFCWFWYLLSGVRLGYDVNWLWGKISNQNKPFLHRLRLFCFHISILPDEYLHLWCSEFLEMFFEDFRLLKEPFLRRLRLERSSIFHLGHLFLFQIPSGWWVLAASLSSRSSAVDIAISMRWIYTMIILKDLKIREEEQCELKWRLWNRPASNNEKEVCFSL